MSPRDLFHSRGVAWVVECWGFRSRAPDLGGEREPVRGGEGVVRRLMAAGGPMGKDGTALVVCRLAVEYGKDGETCGEVWATDDACAASGAPEVREGGRGGTRRPADDHPRSGGTPAWTLVASWNKESM